MDGNGGRGLWCFPPETEGDSSFIARMKGRCRLHLGNCDLMELFYLLEGFN